jgi:hypothetical protein
MVRNAWRICDILCERINSLVECALGDFLHQSAGSAPRLIIGGFVHFGFHLCIVQHHIASKRKQLLDFVYSWFI